MAIKDASSPVKFKIKIPIAGVETNSDGIHETSDRPWIKHLRNLPNDQVEEITDEPDEPDEPE